MANEVIWYSNRSRGEWKFITKILKEFQREFFFFGFSFAVPNGSFVIYSYCLSLVVLFVCSRCVAIVLVYHEPEVTACQANPCGINAECHERNNAGACTCLPEYYGDPYVECRPECVMNSDCPKTRSCFNQKCVDPCVGVCSSNAECFVVNHSPLCTCLPGYTGNPSIGCYEIPRCTFFVRFQIDRRWCSSSNLTNVVCRFKKFSTRKARGSIVPSVTMWTVQSV